MAKETLRSGIVVEHPEGLILRESESSEGTGLRADRPDTSEERDEFLKAVSESPEFTRLDSFELGGAIGQDRLAALENETSPEVVTVRVPLDADEGAVALAESDGVIRWEYPELIEVQPNEAGGLGAMSETPNRVAVFRSRYSPAVNEDEKPESLGLTGDFLLKPFKKIILRFTAKKTAEAVSSYLEKNISEGPMILKKRSDGQFAWESVPSFSGAWSADGKKSVLLLVHGTFSSTEGSFGGLATTPEGRDFLTRAMDQYDTIIGFDHKTLTKTVRENAFELSAKLGTLPAGDITFDAVAFSRGGLVLRYLTESLLPTHPRRFVFRNAVFVACTNGGTKLADPNHWKDLVDLYTNLVSGAGRLVSFVGGPSAILASNIVSGALRGVLSFVRYLATESTTGKAIPGLASMDPNGDDVKFINQRQQGQPVPDRVNYHVIEANFDHSLFGEQKLAELGLKTRLFLEFADGFIDRLFQKAENDLVVDRVSMSQIAPWSTENWIKERHEFLKNDGVYHTVYFNNQQVAKKLASWLL